MSANMRRTTLPLPLRDTRPFLRAGAQGRFRRRVAGIVVEHVDRSHRVGLVKIGDDPADGQFLVVARDQDGDARRLREIVRDGRCGIHLQDLGRVHGGPETNAATRVFGDSTSPATPEANASVPIPKRLFDFLT